MYWNWKIGGVVLGLVFLVAVAWVKPIGVSTQFVVLDGLLAKIVNEELVYKDEQAKSGYGSSNAYLNKSGGKYAKDVANPINYGFIFVVSMVLGGWLASRISGSYQHIKQVPETHSARFGDSAGLRYSLAFIGGVLVLWGARLAGGCTSGHMMSGMMQTSVSGYLFAAAAFAAAIPAAMIVYRQPN